MRYALLMIAAIPMGCQTIQSYFEDDGVARSKPVDMPKLAPGSVEAARRVDAVGRKLIAGTPSLGQDIAFHSVGMSEPEVFHSDSHGLFITEGLVNRCVNDDQLAAVIASELGKMVGEARTRERMALPEPIPSAALGPKLDGSTDYDPARDMELAQFEKKFRKPAEKAMWPSNDPKTICEGLVRDAGVDPKAIGEVAPLLKEAKRNGALARQFGQAGDVPKWSR